MSSALGSEAALARAKAELEVARHQLGSQLETERFSHAEARAVELAKAKILGQAAPQQVPLTESPEARRMRDDVALAEASVEAARSELEQALERRAEAERAFAESKAELDRVRR